jgi:natural product biosynthesis luciferase-like monooxygenase protein
MSFLDFLNTCNNNKIKFSLVEKELKINAPKNILTNEIVAQIKKFKPQIMTWLQNDSMLSSTVYENDITPLSNEAKAENIQASFGQEQIWLTEKLNNMGDSYHFTRVIKMTGNVNLHAIESAFSTIIKRHDALRTVFFEQDNTLYQQVIAHKPLNFTRTDFSLYTPKEQLKKIADLKVSLANKSFDFSNDCMLRVHVLELAKDQVELHITLHHIASDGWSLGLLVAEFQHIYNANIKGENSVLMPLSVQYVDYSYWQRDSLNKHNENSGLNYWESRLSEVPDVHNLPLDYARPHSPSFNRAAVKAILSKETVIRLNALVSQKQTTLFTVLDAIFASFIVRYSDHTDIVIGTVVANREQSAIEGLIGYFANMIALRHQVDPLSTFEQFLTENKKNLANDFAHANTPFSVVVQNIVNSRTSSYSPLVQVAFILQNNEIPDLTLLGIKCEIFETDKQKTLFDLSLEISAVDDTLACSWEYSTDLFSEKTVRQLAENFAIYTENVLADISTPLYKITLVAEQSLSHGTHNRVTAYDKKLCIHQLFELQVVATPEAPALIFEDQSISYQKLNERSNRLAHYLRHQNLVTGDFVGILLERSIDMVVALFAVLKAGGTYIPIDPSYPSQRINYMLSDSTLTFLITDSAVLATIDISADINITCLDDHDLFSDGLNSQCNLVPADICLTAKHLAYVIYTSGSTGKPKGVQVSHQNVHNFFVGLNQKFGHSKQVNTWLAVTSVSFDISVLELFWTLSQGHKVVILPDRPTEYLSVDPMNFSLFYFAAPSIDSITNKYDLLLQGAEFADKNELEGVWIPERHFASFGDQYPNPSIAAAAVAATTKNIKIRAGSVVLPLHDPIRVAEEWSMVDNLSNGRVEIAVASGWHPNDFVLAKDNYAQRHQVLRDHLATVDDLWQGKSINRENGVGKQVDINLHPKPIQSRLPIWITAAGSEETFRYAGSIGANVLTHFLAQTLEDLQEKITVYREALVTAGFAKDHGKVALMLHSFVSDREDIQAVVEPPLKAYLKTSIHLFKPMAEEIGLNLEGDHEALLDFAFQRYYQTSGLFGTAESCLNQVQQFQKIGVNEIANLIDFGIAEPLVLAELPQLKRLQKLSRQHTAKQGLLAKRTQQQWSPFEVIEKHKITHLQCTPAFINDWATSKQGKKALSQLSMLCIGGEAISTQAAKEIHQHVNGQIFNMYGPTETTVWSAIEEISHEPVTIGSAMANTDFYVVDRYNQQVAKGMVGELCITGDGVTQGYLNKKILTEQHFMTNPFGGNSSFYKTGDLVKRLASDRFAFLGRIDEQVKLNGYRIELNEIIHHLEQSDLVDKSVVVVDKQNTEQSALIAYIQLTKDALQAFEQHKISMQLSLHLKHFLPDFMLPASYHFVDDWPLTPNGKIDKKSLVKNTDFAIAQEFIAAESATEKALQVVWSRLLESDPESISMLANFFSLGGHSLLALRLVNEISQEFSIDINANDIFSLAVFKDMAVAIDRLILARETQELLDQEVETQGWL